MTHVQSDSPMSIRSLDAGDGSIAGVGVSRLGNPVFPSTFGRGAATGFLAPLRYFGGRVRSEINPTAFVNLPNGATRSQVDAMLEPTQPAWPPLGYYNPVTKQPVQMDPESFRPQEIQRKYYRPPCGDNRYSGMPAGGIVYRADGSSAGTCSANIPGDPFSPPYDFVCRFGTCADRYGRTSITPDGLCCPGSAKFSVWGASEHNWYY